jgi:hypothetical protein
LAPELDGHEKVREDHQAWRKQDPGQEDPAPGIPGVAPEVQEPRKDQAGKDRHIDVGDSVLLPGQVDRSPAHQGNIEDSHQHQLQQCHPGLDIPSVFGSHSDKEVGIINTKTHNISFGLDILLLSFVEQMTSTDLTKIASLISDKVFSQVDRPEEKEEFRVNVLACLFTIRMIEGEGRKTEAMMLAEKLSETIELVLDKTVGPKEKQREGLVPQEYAEALRGVDPKILKSIAMRIDKVARSYTMEQAVEMSREVLPELLEQLGFRIQFSDLFNRDKVAALIKALVVKYYEEYTTSQSIMSEDLLELLRENKIDLGSAWNKVMAAEASSAKE